MLATVPVYLKLGSEFMPPLWEGSILYMPITMPGISVPEAKKLLQTQDRLIKSFPEVKRVWGKSGRMGSFNRSGTSFDDGNSGAFKAGK